MKGILVLLAVFFLGFFLGVVYQDPYYPMTHGTIISHDQRGVETLIVGECFLWKPDVPPADYPLSHEIKHDREIKKIYRLGGREVEYGASYGSHGRWAVIITQDSLIHAIEHVPCEKELR